MMRENSLHWFPFDPQWWVAKMSILGLSIPAQGVLMRLVCIQWLDDSIPADLSDITKKLGGYTGEGVAEALKLFVHRQGHVHKLYWPAIEALKHECILRSQKLSAAGRKGAHARYHRQAVQSEDKNEHVRN